MFSPSIVKKETTTLKGINIKQDLFCKIYATDPEVLGNGGYAYMKAYGTDNLTSAKVMAVKLLDKPEITARINDYLELDGFNNQAVDSKHNFLIRQNKDFNVSLKAIQEYNKLKKRVDNSIQVIMPKPIMELEDDEVIHKIDKGKARDISQEQNDMA